MVRRLSGTDSLFLAGETPAWHQHVGGLTIVDPTGVAGFGFDALCRNVARRLPLVPKLTWKLKEVPLGLDRAVWVDDLTFDLRRHIHQITVAAPGGPRETAAAVAPIMSRQLDRRYPLWELWYFDGLVKGRVGVLMKFHHCLLDGGAGGVLASLLLDMSPSPEPADIPEMPGPEPPPSDVRLLLDALVPSATAPLRAVRYGMRLARRGVGVARHLRSGNRGARHAHDVVGPEDVVQRADRAAPGDGVQQHLHRRRESVAPPLRRQAQRHRTRAVRGCASHLPARPRRATRALADRRHPSVDSRGRRYVARQPAVVSRGAARHGHL